MESRLEITQALDAELSNYTQLPDVSGFEFGQSSSPDGALQSGSGGHKTVKDYERHLKTLESANFELKLRVHMLEERLQQQDSPDRAQELVVNLKVQLGELREDLAKKRELLIAARDAIELLERQCRSAEASPAQQQCHQLAEQLQLLTAQNQLLSGKSVQLSEQNEQLSGQNEQLTEQLLQLTEQSQQLTEQNEQLTEQLQQLTQSNQQLTQQILQLTDTNQQTHRQLSALQQQSDESRHQLEQLREQLQQSTAAVNSCKADNAKLNGRLKEAVETLRQAGDRLTERTAALAESRGREQRLAQQLQLVHGHRSRLLHWVRHNVDEATAAQAPLQCDLGLTSHSVDHLEILDPGSASTTTATAAATATAVPPPLLTPPLSANDPFSGSDWPAGDAAAQSGHTHQSRHGPRSPTAHTPFIHDGQPEAAAAATTAVAAADTVVAELRQQLAASWSSCRLLRRRLLEVSEFLERLLALEEDGLLDLSSVLSTGDRSQLHQSLLLCRDDSINNNNTCAAAAAASASFADWHSSLNQSSFINASAAAASAAADLSRCASLLPPLSPQNTSRHHRHHQQQQQQLRQRGGDISESETWSEPDRSVSLARIGLSNSSSGGGGGANNNNSGGSAIYGWLERNNNNNNTNSTTQMSESHDRTKSGARRRRTVDARYSEVSGPAHSAAQRLVRGQRSRLPAAADKAVQTDLSPSSISAYLPLSPSHDHHQHDTVDDASSLGHTTGVSQQANPATAATSGGEQDADAQQQMESLAEQLATARRHNTLLQNLLMKRDTPALHSYQPVSGHRRSQTIDACSVTTATAAAADSVPLTLSTFSSESQLLSLRRLEFRQLARHCQQLSRQRLNQSAMASLHHQQQQQLQQQLSPTDSQDQLNVSDSQHQLLGVVDDAQRESPAAAAEHSACGLASGQCADVRRQLATAEQQLLQLTDQLASDRRAHDQLQQLQLQAVADYHELRGVNERLATQLQQLRQQLTEVDSQRHSDLAELARAADRSAELQQLVDSGARDKQLMTEQLRQLSNDKQLLTDRVAQLEKDRQLLSKQLSRLDVDKKLLTDQVDQLEQNIQLLTEQLAKLEHDGQLLKEQIRQYREPLAELEKDKQLLTQQLAQLSSDKQLLTDQLSQLEKDKQLLTDQLSNDKKRLTDRIMQLEKDKQLLTQQLSQLSSEKQLLCNTITQLENNKHQVSAQLSSDKQLLTEQLSQLSIEKQLLTEQLSQLTADKQLLVQHMENGKQQLLDQLSHLTAEKQQLQQQLSCAAREQAEQLARLANDDRMETEGGSGGERAGAVRVPLNNLTPTSRPTQQREESLSRHDQQLQQLRRSHAHELQQLLCRLNSLTDERNDLRQQLQQATHSVMPSRENVSKKELERRKKYSASADESDGVSSHTSADLGIESDAAPPRGSIRNQTAAALPPSSKLCSPGVCRQQVPLQVGEEAEQLQLLRDERDQLHKQLAATRQQLQLANERLSRCDQRKVRVEKAICRQLTKTHDILQRAKTNLATVAPPGGDKENQLKMTRPPANCK